MTTELTPPEATVRVQQIVRIGESEVTTDIEITGAASLDALREAAVAAIRALDADDEGEEATAP